MQHYSEKKRLVTQKIGELIQKLRSQKNHSCRSFAYENGLSRPNLNKIEKGLILCKSVTLMEISHALGLKFSEFVILLEKELGDDFTLIDE